MVSLYACMFDWLLFLGLQIRPLVKPTKAIIIADNINYSWHDFVSKSKHWCAWLWLCLCCFLFDISSHQSAFIFADNHNALTVVSVWAPVVAVSIVSLFVYLLPPSSNMLIIKGGYIGPGQPIAYNVSSLWLANSTDQIHIRKPYVC